MEKYIYAKRKNKLVIINLFWKPEVLHKIYSKFEYDWFTSEDFLITFWIKNKSLEENKFRVRAIRLHKQRYLDKKYKDKIIYYRLSNKSKNIYNEGGFFQGRLYESCKKRAKNK